MRLSLKRTPGTAPRKPLRERIDEARARLADTKVRAGKAIAVAKILMKPEAPKPASVDRVALVNYASWLLMERNAVCRELYPLLGRRCTAFMPGLGASERFFFPPEGSDQSKPDPASSRAVAVLDLVGVAWREDLTDSRRDHFDGCERAIYHPGSANSTNVPHGWPRADAALLEALDDLIRIDAAQQAIYDAGDQDREGDTVPGYDDLEASRSDALTRLARERAESPTGLQAKAKALLTRSITDDSDERRYAIASSLAQDLLGTHPIGTPQPDPILAAIAECERLEAEVDAFERTIPRDQDVPPDTCHAVMVHFHDVLLKTVPTTAEGCKALARFVPAFFERWGSSLDDAAPIAFALIARSPLL